MESESQLQNLKVHKAIRPDNILARFLKESSHVIAPILTLISFCSIPNDWKKANIAPIYKKENRNKPILYHLQNHRTYT